MAKMGLILTVCSEYSPVAWLTGSFQSQGREEEEEEEEPETAFQCQSSVEEMDEEISHSPTLPSIRLKMNTFYDQVEFVKNPSEFWIRLRNTMAPSAN